jgi:hypothetical protein
MTTITFDTHKFVCDLQAAGLGAKESEAITNAIKEAQSSADLATKQDLREMELRMTVRLGTAIVAAIGAMTAIVKLFG